MLIFKEKKNALFALVFVVIFNPFSLLAQTQLLGVTTEGGAVDSGVVFRTDGNGNGLVADANFNKSVGAAPNSNFVKYNNNEYYGLTWFGGTNNIGTIYKYNPTTRELTKKIDFEGLSNGSQPGGKLLLASDGMFYGLTYFGGTNDLGVLFQYNPITNECYKRIDFNGANNGSYPVGSLIQAPNGMLYGMTSSGGANDMGVLFEYSFVTNTLTKKIDFDGASKGSAPYADLCLASDGLLYGMTQMGGTNDNGVIFSYQYSTNTLIVKRSFANPTGSNPQGSLFQANNGMLYGTTLGGGSNTAGVLFKFNPTNSNYNVLVNFEASTSGRELFGDLMQASNGMLYGYAQMGGANDMGVLYELNPTTEIFTKKFDFGTTNGERPVFASVIEIPLEISCTSSTNVFCAGNTFSVPYTLSGAYELDNVFSVQLSDENGSFGSPTTLGSSNDYLDGSIMANVPSNVVAGLSYRIRVVSSNPVVIGADNGTDIVIGNPIVIANASDLSICAGDSVVLYGEGALSYSWSHSVIDSIAIFPTSTETYTVVGTDANNCSNESMVNVEYNLLPVVSAHSSEAVVCFGQEISVYGDGAYKYSWSNGVANNVPFMPMGSNTYTVTGIDMNGCTDTATIYVEVLPLPDNGVFVDGEMLTSFDFNATYQWLDCNNALALIPGEIGQIFNPTQNGNYAVEVVLNGCSDTSDCISVNTIGVKNVIHEANINIYPNPASSIINLDVSTAINATKINNEPAIITIENMLGQVVYSLYTNKLTNSINISELTTGVYFVKVNSSDHHYTNRFIKQ